MQRSKVSAVQKQFLDKRIAFGEKPVNRLRTKYFAYMKPAASPASTLAEMKVTLIDYNQDTPQAAIIGDFGVRPKWRQFGVARKLMEYVLADNTLPNKLVLYAKPAREGNQSISQRKLEAFYASFGFVLTGTRSYESKYPGVEMLLDRSLLSVAANFRGKPALNAYERFRIAEGLN